MRVPWDRFHKAYEEYLRWEALALWVRAVVETEGSAPSWLVATIKKRCPGFIENDVLLNEPRLLGFRFKFAIFGPRAPGRIGSTASRNGIESGHHRIPISRSGRAWREITTRAKK